ncbi:MAG: 23S rRNA (guanosine(2251)-2'-O)-methyltransferase RlmB [Rhodospirillaceae bacterium]|jgi:23S rRNA (guanosine2251-2'-O)-methyltransferase|nr:23S rRNA (guanosine(2251)-2'-O)-methyltransferase RlmB [Rhodospirillaceae bacterium]MBT5242331.1 23S rRNA (guanosine(2251)-2'-O)-methyltransferase RlmB [Rhodospirillaceae bacterium]MBT5564527.1 23S rRNA (guanosine(2251)-2'-O)-methyltransferase RlmB [Rhodospirillaceae bacterium]MBT6087943.1 23S rRNA (guanosine(2251)-2'-O)-methyltransferase RlmB [Rhodospirillaceae bacterium]MBT7450334.1 23S rRNA (guanosine(2251)-2'-O)-methyltransferase RlmB [Rhodospirillaceae bacterium]
MARTHQSKSNKTNRRGGGNSPRVSREQHRKPSGQDGAGGGLWLYGLHAVETALANPDRRIDRLLATPEAADKLAAKGLSRDRLSHIEPADRSAIDAILGAEKVHQGVALKTQPLPAMDIQDALAGLASDDPALVVALDHVTDPHNVGAVLRSASAFGVRAVLTTKHNAPEETGVLAKSASGALESVPIVRVTNLGRSIKDCQDLGFWVVGLDASGTEDLDRMEMPTRCVLVLGAEGEGLRPSIRSACDFMARLPMTGQMESLNVSNAAAVSMFEWMRQQRAK